MGKNEFSQALCLIAPASVFLVGALIQGCTETSHMVIASTATSIGLEISQNPATSSPQAKLGYNRAELALVPSNRSKNKDPGNFRNGAQDVADVLMELKYSGIFDWRDSGIYQRLAVGTTAVKQHGAAFLFAKDASGSLDPGTATAMQQLINADELVKTQFIATNSIGNSLVSDGTDTMDETKLKIFFNCADFNATESQRLATKYKNKPKSEFISEFLKDFGWMAPAYTEKCIKK